MKATRKTMTSWITQIQEALQSKEAAMGAASEERAELLEQEIEQLNVVLESIQDYIDLA